MNVYQLHGVTIRSEIALGTPARVESPIDLEVRWGERRAIPDEPPAGHPNACDFFLSKDLRRLRVHASPEAEALVPILLAGTVLAAVLSLGGRVVLHASAIHHDGWT